MSEVVDSVKYPSLPSNYVSIVHLQERWLKEKQRKQQQQQEKENQEKKQNPVGKYHQNPIVKSRENEGVKQYPVGQNHQKRVVNDTNYSAKSWRELGLVAKETKLKEVEEGEKKRKKRGYFGKRKPRVERDMGEFSNVEVGEEEEMVSVENGGRELCKGKCKEFEEVATVCMVEVVGESNADREFAGNQCGGVGFSEGKHSGRKMGYGVGEVSEKGDNAEKEKVRMRGTFCAYRDKEEDSICQVVQKSKVDREIMGQKCGVGFKGKKHRGRRMGDGVGEVSDKVDSVERSGQERNGEKEEVSVVVKERTNEKVKKVSGAYGDMEVEEVATVCAVEVVEENKVYRKITGQKCRVGHRGKKYSWRKIDDGIGEVSDKANCLEQSGQECNAEKEKVSIDVKERTNEKVRVRGAFRAYGDKSKDESIDSETVLKMTIERDLGDLSLTDRRRYGHGRMSVRGYGDWRYGTSRRYEPRKLLKQRDNSFAWIKKGESSNGNAAEIETQVANYAGFPV
ncbi:hypothetical protein T459_30822 [Capsicum annuum]|uniref:Uncharacterized protein n=1 Tax=Capsicum annuum TaxID=4072 RepID=A0A2G2Y9G0_CAPAN|nr:hypothetical protein T459_30822 [Capsicum annuum]